MYIHNNDSHVFPLYFMQLATDIVCGNGFLEDGEQCDCGTQEVIENVTQL